MTITIDGSDFRDGNVWLDSEHHRHKSQYFNADDLVGVFSFGSGDASEWYISLQLVDHASNVITVSAPDLQVQSRDFRVRVTDVP